MKKEVESIVNKVFILASVFWVYSSTVVASANIWVAVPFIGYCRLDFVTMLLSIQTTFIYITWTRSSSRWITMGAVLFLLCLPYIPEMYRPMIYMRPLAAMIDYNLKLSSSSYGVSVHSSGFSNEDAASLVDMTMKYKDRWVHIDYAQSLGYFIFGSSINFYRKQNRMKYRGKGYTFKYGMEPTDEVFKHESSFRLNYRDDMADVQSILHEQLAPKLRQVLANTLSIDTDQVVFGNEIGGGGYEKSHLGMPAIGIIFPHVLWHWIQNPHDDGVYRNRVPTNMVPCKKADDVTTFLIPLTAPEGSGLRDWTKEQDGNVVMHETKYEVGNVYTFAASNTLHSIGPLPYFEWTRSQYRINIQAFGVQCNDLKWYIYH